MAHAKTTRLGTLKTPHGMGTLTRTQYPSNGAVALVIDGDSGRIATVSVNLDHGQPCTQSGDLPADHFYVDANNLSADFLAALQKSGFFEKADVPDGVSGYCTYPVWKVLARVEQAA